MTDTQYRILMVCTGNICRSPLMERLFVARLREKLDDSDVDRFEVSSCGSWGLVGSAMEPAAAQTLVELGGDPSGFVARAMEPELLEAADLILVATREHRRLVATASPQTVSRVMTAREFARLLGPVSAADIGAASPASDPVARMRAIVAAALANRGLVELPTPGEDDIADPYGRDREAYARAAAEIDAALAVPLRLLLGA